MERDCDRHERAYKICVGKLNIFGFVRELVPKISIRIRDIQCLKNRKITSMTRKKNSQLRRNAYFFVVLTCKEKG